MHSESQGTVDVYAYSGSIWRPCEKVKFSEVFEAFRSQDPSHIVIFAPSKAIVPLADRVCDKLNDIAQALDDARGRTEDTDETEESQNDALYKFTVQDDFHTEEQTISLFMRHIPKTELQIGLFLDVPDKFKTYLQSKIRSISRPDPSLEFLTHEIVAWHEAFFNQIAEACKERPAVDRNK
ncbi:hypothetical protein FE257_002311 [Aspergillus nanangensis]|uniref:Uncharacterized protein n=1 Tax=Aspergillus nanangensis TaxID=2582783 RepID=A0AAD4GP51_ASPNN|nr:hypothetical protein FE257_002311 [Aspergillus nanangensis]